MTPKQDEQLVEIGKLLLALFPSMHGNVWFRFNLNPDKKYVNMNYGNEESVILTKRLKNNEQ